MSVKSDAFLWPAVDCVSKNICSQRSPVVNKTFWCSHTARCVFAGAFFHVMRAFKDPFEGHLFPHDSVKHAAIGYLVGNREALTAACCVQEWGVGGGSGFQESRCPGCCRSPRPSSRRVNTAAEKHWGPVGHGPRTAATTLRPWAPPTYL